MNERLNMVMFVLHMRGSTGSCVERVSSKEFGIFTRLHPCIPRVRLGVLTAHISDVLGISQQYCIFRG